MRFILDSLLRPYALALFSQDARVGAVVLLAVGTAPRLLAHTLLAVAMAALVSLLFGLGWAAVREGAHGCTALLTALALQAFAPDTGHPVVLTIMGAGLATLVGASFQAVFAAVAVPAYALPFIAASWLVHLAARVLPPASSSVATLPAGSSRLLDIPASVLFLHGAAAGALVILALLLHSRIALLLAAAGALVAVGLHGALRGAPWSVLETMAAMNAVVTAMVIGGVWFVPQWSSLLLGAASAGVAVVVTWALVPLLGVAGLPVLSLPFVVTTHAVLLAARRRQRDLRPRSVAVPAPRPEDAQHAYLAHLRRFGASAWLPFRLPFRGEWVVSQGHDGAHTHQGLWRHGLDFEGHDAAGQAFTGAGTELRHFHCYGLPVLAAGSGTVALVVDGVPDNRVGEVNTRDNWGNAVVVCHGAALYSVYAHLQPRSVKVKPGDVVLAGAELGRCGNSGRAATPHLHFQVQQAAPLGSPTVPVDFGDVVTMGPQPRLGSRIIPRQGERVRPVMRDEGLGAVLAFPPGRRFELLADDGTREVAEVELDLLGRRLLRSDRGTAVLDVYDGGVVVLETRGDSRSLLRLLLLPLARVPLDQAPSLTFHERLSRRPFLPVWLRPLAGLTDLLVPGLLDLDIEYTTRRTTGTLELVGRARRFTTRATLSLAGDEHHLVVDGQGAVRLRPLTVSSPSEEVAA